MLLCAEYFNGGIQKMHIMSLKMYDLAIKQNKLLESFAANKFKTG